MRTVPGISDEFKPLDDAIDTFIRTIIRGYRFSFDERELFALPAKLGGLGIIIPSKICDPIFKLENYHGRTDIVCNATEGKWRSRY